MTIGSAREGPGPMPAMVAGIILAIVLPRWLGWTAGLVIAAVGAVAVHVILRLIAGAGGNKMSEP